MEITCESRSLWSSFSWLDAKETCSKMREFAVKHSEPRTRGTGTRLLVENHTIVIKTRLVRNIRNITLSSIPPQ